MNPVQRRTTKAPGPIPRLFGYTEEARRAKRTVHFISSSSRRKWDEQSFFDEAGRNLDTQGVVDLRRLYDLCRQNAKITWGTGKTIGSFNPKWLRYFPQAPVSIRTDGSITMNFGYITGSAEADRMRENLRGLLFSDMGILVPDDYDNSYPTYPYSDWAGHVDKLCSWIEQTFQS